MKNRENEGDQPGAQTHAEGQYGDRTRSANRERIRQSEGQADGEGDDQPDATDPGAGRHRLDEDRQQHDEADKNSEKNRERNRARDR